jgi:2-methylcitrate dehydratase PrpD
MMFDTPETPQSTRGLAEFAAGCMPEDLPEPVRREARRAFLNIVGCAIGGASHEIVCLVKSALRPYWGPPQAQLVAQPERADILHAAYLNCLASSVDSFDDSHAEAIVHPAGTPASSLLALGELRGASGAGSAVARKPIVATKSPGARVIPAGTRYE